jgi:3',5'-cyclic AMP phosphodiesterase CpdA
LDGPEHWAFLSDVHIEANPATVSKQGVNMADNLRRVVAEVLAERDGLDAVVINGDCAYLEGIRGDYETLAGILAPLRQAGLPIHCTLGNHDDRGSFQAALADLCPAAAPVDGKVISVVEGRCAHWVFLDSLRFVNKVEGEFGPQQLAWLEQHLRAQTAKPVILVGHHYPQAYRDDLIPGDQKIPIAGLIDGEAFLTLANRVPNVKAYIYGHSHDWRITASETKLHEVNLPPTAYVFNPARPSGWVRAKVDATGMTLELKALDQTHPEHGMTRTLSWR